MLDDPMIFPNVKFIVQHKCVWLNSTNQSINQSKSKTRNQYFILKY